MKTFVNKGLPAGIAVLATLGVGGLLPFSTTAFAQTTPSAATPKISLTQAEQIATSTFTIPKDYNLQSESYSSNTNNSTQPAQYNLNYQNSNPASSNESLNVSINANTGTIMNFNRQSQENQFIFPVPVSADKAKQVADQWATKLFPGQVGQVKALPLAPSFGALQGPTQYNYSYERVVNGIAAPFDGFTLTIDQTGKLIAAQDHWTEMTFPTAKGVIAKSQANQIYSNSLGLHLAYQSIYSANSQPATDLVYESAPQSYPGYWGQLFTVQDSIQFPVIDASTGKVIDSTGTVTTPSAYTAPKPLVPGGPTSPIYPKPVNWNQDQAMQFAQKMFGITSQDTLQNVNQYINPQTDTTWNFSWRTHADMNLNVAVDATTGTIANFSQYPTNPPQQNSNNARSKLTQAQATVKVDAFVQKLFANNTGGIAVVPQPGPSGSAQIQTSYQILPLVNGIPDEANGGNVSLDLQTGTIQNLYMNNQTQGGTRPSPAQAMTTSAAASTWMAARPLTLEYLETQPQMAGKIAAVRGTVAAKAAANAAPEIVLVYAPIADQSASGQFNAVTGKFETYNSKVPFTGTIQDISGLAAAPQIRLLVDRELISVDRNGDVHPKQSMTHSAFIKLLVDALGYQGRINAMAMKSSAAQAALAAVPTTSPDYQEVASAYSLGWIPADEQFNPNATTSRDYAAQVLSRALNMTALLSHSDAFQFSPSDAASIPSGDKAGDALMTILGVMTLDNGAFHPTDAITLADTAVAVVQAADVLGFQGHPYHPGM